MNVLHTLKLSGPFQLHTQVCIHFYYLFWQTLIYKTFFIALFHYMMVSYELQFGTHRIKLFYYVIAFIFSEVSDFSLIPIAVGIAGHSEYFAFYMLLFFSLLSYKIMNTVNNMIVVRGVKTQVCIIKASTWKHCFRNNIVMKRETLLIIQKLQSNLSIKI